MDYVGQIALTIQWENNHRMQRFIQKSWGLPSLGRKKKERNVEGLCIPSFEATISVPVGGCAILQRQRAPSAMVLTTA